MQRLTYVVSMNRFHYYGMWQEETVLLISSTSNKHGISVSACVCLHKYRCVLVLVRWAVMLHTFTLHAHAHSWNQEINSTVLTMWHVCTNLVPRPMGVVFGLGTRLYVRMRTILENGVLHNEQQPQSVVNGFYWPRWIWGYEDAEWLESFALWWASVSC